MNSSDSDIDVEPDWKKVERDMTKVGLKNGLSDGRDSNFQRSFDKGYQDGFQNGFELGKLNFQRNNYKYPVTAQTSELLENASKGMCIVCTTEKDNENVADVRAKQIQVVISNLETIKQDLKLQS